MSEINTSQGALLEALNAKVDLDFLNAAPCTLFKSQSCGWAMPSDEYVSTSFVKATIGTYTWTAPVNGYFSFTGVCSTGGSTVVLYKDNIIIDKHSSSGHNFALVWPFKKSDIIKVTIGTNSLYALTSQTFFYAEGEI